MKTFKVLAFFAIVVLISAFAVNSLRTNNGSGYVIGDIADDFALKNVDGSMVSLSDYDTAKGFIVIFTCNTCPFSVANEDRIIALDVKYKYAGYPVIAINPNNAEVKPGDSFAEMKIRSKAKGFTFPYLLDEGQKVYPSYGATKTPNVYLLEKSKKGLLVQYIGAIDDNSRSASAVKTKFLENAVNALLEGKRIEVTTTKAIGCSIKA
ncbi:MAG: peroxiredoxin [Dokdonia sp.]|jgi:peroxiredoxin